MIHSSLFTSSILGGQLTATTFPPLENFRQWMKLSHKFTVNSLINEFKSLKYQRVFFPCTLSGLLVANIILLSLLLGDGDGVFPDDDGISPGENGLVCSFSSPDFSMLLTECFSGLPKNCVCRLLLLDDLELLDTCESLSPSPLFLYFLFSGLVLSADLVSSDLFSWSCPYLRIRLSFLTLWSNLLLGFGYWQLLAFLWVALRFNFLCYLYWGYWTVNSL